MTSDPSIKGPKFDTKARKLDKKPKLVMIMALGQRPKLPQHLCSQLNLTLIMN